MEIVIKLDKREKSDWLKENTLTSEQFKQLILQKVERNKGQSAQTRKQLA